MGILQTSLPRKNDLSLDKLLLGFILGEKIHLHWNKCQGMAREFILFAHICHWMGGKTAVPFKHLAGWRNATEARWKPLVNGGRHELPQGWINPAILLFFLGLWQTSFSSELYGWGRTWKNGFLSFARLLIFLWIYVNIVIIYFLIWKGNRRRTMAVDTMPLALFTGSLFEPLVSTKWHCLGLLSNLCVVGLSQWMFAVGDMALKMVSTLVPPSSTLSSHVRRSEEAQPPCFCLRVEAMLAPSLCSLKAEVKITFLSLKLLLWGQSEETGNSWNRGRLMVFMLPQSVCAVGKP